MQGVAVPEANLSYARIAETVLERLQISTLCGARGRWRDVEVDNSRFGSAEERGIIVAD